MRQLGFRVTKLIGGLDCWRYERYPVDGLETCGTCRLVWLLVIQTQCDHDAQ